MAKKTKTTKTKKKESLVNETNMHWYVRNVDRKTQVQIKTLASAKGQTDAEFIQNMYAFVKEVRDIDNSKVQKLIEKYDLGPVIL